MMPNRRINTLSTRIWASHQVSPTTEWSNTQYGLLGQDILEKSTRKIYGHSPTKLMTVVSPTLNSKSTIFGKSATVLSPSMKGSCQTWNNSCKTLRVSVSGWPYGFIPSLTWTAILGILKLYRKGKWIDSIWINISITNLAIITYIYIKSIL